MVHECPLKFKLCYIDRIRDKGSIYALMGQAMHELLKDVVEHDVDRAAAIAEWQYYFEREATKGGVRFFTKYEFLLKKGYILISIFFKYKKELDIKKVISLEVRDRMNFDGDEYIYVCDLIYENSKGEIVLLDYKTGKVKEIDTYQIEFYGWQPKYKIDKLCLFYFDTPRFYDVGMYKEETKRYIRAAIKTIKLGDFYKVVSKNCRYCDLLKLGHCNAKYDK